MKIIYALNCDEIQVSDCDHLFLSGYNWSFNTGYYRCTNSCLFNNQQVHNKFIQYFIIELIGLKVPDGYTVDHIDRNVSNNIRPNLRIASPNMQSHNTSLQYNNTIEIAGVRFVKKNKIRPWVARICINSKQIQIGSYFTSEEANVAYQVAKKNRDAEEEQRVKEKLSFL